MRRIFITLLLISCTADNGPSDTTEDPLTSGFIETTESSSGSESSSSGDDSTTESSSSSESESSGPSFMCEPEKRGEHEPCGDDCFVDCTENTACTWSYLGGYLAECETKCADDEQCSVGDVCSNNHCVTPCGPNRECAEGTFCYPGLHMDGTPVIDPAHPLPHCMPLAG